MGENSLSLTDSGAAERCFVVGGSRRCNSFLKGARRFKKKARYSNSSCCCRTEGKRGIERGRQKESKSFTSRLMKQQQQQQKLEKGKKSTEPDAWAYSCSWVNAPTSLGTPRSIDLYVCRGSCVVPSGSVTPADG